MAARRALAQPFQALTREAVVRGRVDFALVDDAGAGLDVVFDAVAGEPIVAVVEDRAPDRDGVAGLPIDLDAVGDQAALAASDLDVAGGHEQVVRSDLLEAVGDDRDFAARRLDALLTLSSGERWGDDRRDAREQEAHDRNPGPRHESRERPR